MRNSIRILLAALAILSAVPATKTAWAAGEPSTPGPGMTEDLSSARKRWSDMSDQDREKIRENYRKWKGLSPERKQQLVERFKRFQSLSPEMKQRIVRNFHAFQKLSPEQREKIRGRFQKFQKLPPEERKKRLEMLKKRREAVRARKATHARDQDQNDDNNNRPAGVRRRWLRRQ